MAAVRHIKNISSQAARRAHTYMYRIGSDAKRGLSNTGVYIYRNYDIDSATSGHCKKISDLSYIEKWQDHCELSISKHVSNSSLITNSVNVRSNNVSKISNIAHMSQRIMGLNPSRCTGILRAKHCHIQTTFRHIHTSTNLCLKLKSVEKWKPGSVPQIEVPSWSNVAEFEDKLFDYLCEEDGTLKISTFKEALTSTGLRESDPRLKECIQGLTHTAAFLRDRNEGSDGTTINRDYFKECITKNIVIIAKAFQSQLILPDFGTFCEQIDEIYWKARENIGGQVATYIPQLARYSPKLWGVSVCTVDGQRYSVGDVNIPFCLQSTSKPLNYAMALDDLTPSVLHEYVGQEPSGTSFNTISLDYKDKPHNPMINAGAIVVCSLLRQELNQADRFDYVRICYNNRPVHSYQLVTWVDSICNGRTENQDSPGGVLVLCFPITDNRISGNQLVTQMYKRLCGGEYLAFNNSVFLSEKETADRNFAIAYYMREKKCFPMGSNLMEVLDFYFQVTCESGSVIAATLANGGICPITGDKVFSAQAVQHTLSLMLSCGMYDYSGEFAFKVGLPCKSGVSGGILLVVPNKMGMFIWSPALDSWGNSVRGVQFCKDLVAKFNFHHYDNLKFTLKKIDPCQSKIESRATDVVNLLFSAYNNDISALRRFALGGTDMDQADYDGRTALHIGAAEGHETVVRFLIDKCKCSPLVVDRWGFTPLDDAKRFKRNKIIKILELAMLNFDAETKIDRSFKAIDSTRYGEVTFGGDSSYVPKTGSVNDIEFYENSDEITNKEDSQTYKPDEEKK